MKTSYYLILLLLLYTAGVCETRKRTLFAIIVHFTWPVSVDNVGGGGRRGIGDTFTPIQRGCGVRTRVCVTITPKGGGGTLFIQKARAIRVYECIYLYIDVNRIHGYIMLVVRKMYTRPNFKHCVINNACAPKLSILFAPVAQIIRQTFDKLI